MPEVPRRRPAAADNARRLVHLTVLGLVRKAHVSVGPLIGWRRLSRHRKDFAARLPRQNTLTLGARRFRPPASSGRLQQLVQCAQEPWSGLGSVGRNRRRGDQWLHCQRLSVNDECLIDPDRLHRQAERDATRSFNRQQSIHTSRGPFWQGTGFARKPAVISNKWSAGLDRWPADVAAPQHLGANQAGRLSSG